MWYWFRLLALKTIKFWCVMSLVSIEIWWTVAESVFREKIAVTPEESQFTLTASTHPVWLTWSKNAAVQLTLVHRANIMAQCRVMNYARSMHCGAVCRPHPNFPVQPNMRNTPAGDSSSKRTLNAQVFELAKLSAHKCARSHILAPKRTIKQTLVHSWRPLRAIARTTQS